MPPAKKSNNPKLSEAARPTATELVQTLQNADEPLSWRALSVGLNSLERKALRNLLRGLVRNGEISQDAQGAYHAMAERELETGVLERRGRTLAFADVPIATDFAKRDLRLRAGDTVEVRRISGSEGEQIRVLRVVEHAPQPLIGELRQHARYPYVESLSPEYKGRISLLEPPADAAHGDSVAVRIVDQDRRGYVGLVEQVISRRGGVRHAADTLIASYGIPTQWPEAAMQEAAALPDSVDPSDYPERLDLTKLPLVTIDGESARDFDDAVYAEPDGDGWRLLVAIADVAHYVKPGSALDQEALARGNSVYLPDRVIPMLPEALSNELCSLRPEQVRLSMVCDMRVAASGEITGFEFSEALIRSWARLTYTEVQGYLDSRELESVDPLVCQSLDALNELLGVFTSGREARGALDFEAHEASLEIVDDKLVALHPVERLAAHRLIEEAMIAANICAATFLESVGALYRVHEAPQTDRADLVRQAFAAAGVTIAKDALSGKSVQAALAQLHARPDHWIFEMLVLRSLPQAVYSPENKGHFGLALERYMHFTSPIRRYADLVVHRAIKALLAKEPAPMAMDALIACGEQVSYAERRAEELGYRVEGWLKCELVSSQIGEIFDGVVMGVTDFGLFVELTGHYVQGLLHVSELGDDYFSFQPVPMALVGEGSGRKFSLGDALSVQLHDVEPALGRLDLALAPAPGAAMPGIDKPAGEKSRGDQGRQRSRNRSDKPRKRRRGGKNKGKSQTNSQGQGKSQGQ
jgi:ribonuclease R